MSDDYSHLVGHRFPGAPGRQHAPSLQRFADAREALPSDGGAIGVDVEHVQLASGHQRELQGVDEGDLAGFGEIGRMEDAQAHAKARRLWPRCASASRSSFTKRSACGLSP